MNQFPPVYNMASALEALEPWLTEHLPQLDPAGNRLFSLPDADSGGNVW